MQNFRTVQHRGKWAIAWRDDAGITRKRSTGLDATPENRPEADRRARSAEIEARRHHCGVSVSDILAAYIADMPLRMSPVLAIDRAKYARDALVGFFGSHGHSDVTRDECRAYTDLRRGDGVSDWTIIRELGVLAAALRWHDPNTPARIEKPPAPPKEWADIPEGVIASMIGDQRNAPHIRLFILLAIVTGGRSSALLGLTWDTHIDFDANQVFLGFKAGGKNRATMPMTAELRSALLEAQSYALTPYVIEWRGKPVGSVKRGLRRAYDLAGYPQIKSPAHSLRETSGCMMARRGVSMAEISARLGHSSIAVTERHYARVHPDYMQKSTAALSNIGGVPAFVPKSTANKTGGKA